MLRRIVVAIGALTIVTGLAQIVWPGRMLALVGVSDAASEQQLFATVGMFMALFGGAVCWSETHADSRGEILPWATLQKAFASAFVAAGVARHVFAGRALVVAAFDGLSACVFAAHWWTRR